MAAIETLFDPVIEELRPDLDADAAFRRLCCRRRVIFLDSALRHPQLGRYSFVSADPFDFLTVPADGTDGLAALASRIQCWQTAPLAGLPPFQGGAAGLFAYDLHRSVERIPLPRYDEFRVPAMAIGFYDVVIATDHVQRRTWMISQGFPERDPGRRRARAEERIAQFQQWLRAGDVRGLPPSRPARADPLAPDQLAPQFATQWADVLTSNFAADSYQAAVRRAVEYIQAGDIFQVNLAQRLLHPASDSPLELYYRLRERNAATFAAYFDLDDFQILSASPERFLRVSGRAVETRPIKGTRPRTARPEADLYAADELRSSEKDRAENVMIVDLLRNDLSRVCRPDSVRVTQLCALERYEFVQHLVSAVQGELEEGQSNLDLIRAAFPGGSISGAPKVRAMEIIAEIEPTARGAYCGALGYLGFDGSMDLNLLIRTITVGRGWWQMPVGGGIVAQSDPRREYEETWHKATGLLRSLR